MLSADPPIPRRRGKGGGGGGGGEGNYARNCINIPRPMALNLAMLNDYRTCTCTSYTMHRHTAPVVFILVLLIYSIYPVAGRPYEKIPFSPLYN